MWKPISVFGPSITELVERAQHPPARVLAVDAVHDQLRDHRVVGAETSLPAATPESTRTPGPDGSRYAVTSPGVGRKPVRDVLGVDAALDRVAAQLDLLLRQRQRLAERDPDLLAHEIEPGDHLGHRVLDLDARVHLHEEVLAVRREQALDRPGRAVAARARRVDADRADPRAQLGVDRRRRRLLDELLVAALDRAVALAEVDDVAVRVGEHLHLDVARVDDQLLDVDARVREVRLPLALRRLERALGLRRARRTSSMPLPPPPAAALISSG